MSPARTPALASSCAHAVRTPSSGAFGVVSVFSTITSPDAASRSTRSVNVPPMSTARRQSRRSLMSSTSFCVRGGAKTSRIHTSSSSSSPMNLLSPCHTVLWARYTSPACSTVRVWSSASPMRKSSAPRMMIPICSFSSWLCSTEPPIPPVIRQNHSSSCSPSTTRAEPGAVGLLERVVLEEVAVLVGERRWRCRWLSSLS